MEDGWGNGPLTNAKRKKREKDEHRLFIVLPTATGHGQGHCLSTPPLFPCSPSSPPQPDGPSWAKNSPTCLRLITRTATKITLQRNSSWRFGSPAAGHLRSPAHIPRATLRASEKACVVEAYVDFGYSIDATSFKDLRYRSPIQRR